MSAHEPVSRMELPGGVELLRPKSAAWDAPWRCARCEEPSPPPDFANCRDFISWAMRHQKGACP